MDNNRETIDLDNTTYQIVCLSIFNSYTMGFGDVEKDTGFSKKRFEELDRKYSTEVNKSIDHKDLAVIVSGLKWLIGVEGISDATDTLDITRDQGARLINLLESKQPYIQEQDWQ